MPQITQQITLEERVSSLEQQLETLSNKLSQGIESLVGLDELRKQVSEAGIEKYGQGDVAGNFRLRRRTAREDMAPYRIKVRGIWRYNPQEIIKVLKNEP